MVKALLHYDIWNCRTNRIISSLSTDSLLRMFCPVRAASGSQSPLPKPGLTEKAVRVGAQPRDHVRVFQQKIARFGEQVPEQPGLAGPARTGQHHGWKVVGGAVDLHFEFPAEVFHG